MYLHIVLLSKEILSERVLVHRTVVELNYNKLACVCVFVYNFFKTAREQTYYVIRNEQRSRRTNVMRNAITRGWEQTRVDDQRTVFPPIGSSPTA